MGCITMYIWMCQWTTMNRRKRSERRYRKGRNIMRGRVGAGSRDRRNFFAGLWRREG
jgi:hypothetical protein